MQGGGAGEVEGLKPWLDKDGIAAGTVEMLDLTAGMGIDGGEGRRLRRPGYEDSVSVGCMGSLTCTVDTGK